MPERRTSPTGQKTPPRWTKPLEWWLTRGVLRTLDRAGRVLPAAALPALGRSLGILGYHCMRRYRDVARANLRRAYPEWPEAKVEATARESFRHLGTMLVEFFLRQPRITDAEVDAAVRFEGQAHYEAALARGKGVLLVTAHYGNWEMMGPRLHRAGYQVNAISRTADDPGIERMIESIRTRCGLRQIPREQAARQGLAALRRNEILAILLDQNTVSGGIFVPFFGYPASTAVGPAVFALKTGAALVPTFCIREADGTHTMRAWPPIYPESTGDRDADIRQLTAEVTGVIEAQIRERPELWFWLHNRWKLQPDTTAGAVDLNPVRQKGTMECNPCD